MTHELREYQSAIREQEQAQGYSAVFQADFLLLKVPNKGVQLHRVACGVWIIDALHPDVSFTTAEYDHTPQEGVPGLWGTFEAARNATYNPADKKSGTLFSRLHNVVRDMIVVYNVQVFTRIVERGLLPFVNCCAA